METIGIYPFNKPKSTNKLGRCLRCAHYSHTLKLPSRLLVKSIHLKPMNLSGDKLAQKTGTLNYNKQRKSCAEMSHRNKNEEVVKMQRFKSSTIMKNSGESLLQETGTQDMENRIINLPIINESEDKTKSPLDTNRQKYNQLSNFRLYRNQRGNSLEKSKNRLIKLRSKQLAERFATQGSCNQSSEHLKEDRFQKINLFGKTKFIQSKIKMGNRHVISRQGAIFKDISTSKKKIKVKVNKETAAEQLNAWKTTDSDAYFYLSTQFQI